MDGEGSVMSSESLRSEATHILLEDGSVHPMEVVVDGEWDLVPFIPAAVPAGSVSEATFSMAGGLSKMKINPSDAEIDAEVARLLAMKGK
jgi:hypothetical protein